MCPTGIHWVFTQYYPLIIMVMTMIIMIKAMMVMERKLYLWSKIFMSGKPTGLQERIYVRSHTVRRVQIGTWGGASDKESTCQCRRQKRQELDPWVRKIPWRRAWQPTPVFLPGKPHGQRRLASCSPWGCKELDTTERLTHTHAQTYILINR